MVSTERQIWHCFGCNEGGDIFKFVMKMEGLEFPDALRLLAQKAGVTLKKVDPKLKTQRQHNLDICQWAEKFFIKQLHESKNGKSALAYLKKRAVNAKTINDFKIGFAPDDWTSLFNFLLTKNFTSDEIVASGLCIKSDNDKSTNKYFDRFRSRIIFPISDANGQTIAFGGRIYPKEKETENTAKYLNSPETLLYQKSRVLFGLDKAKQSIRQNNLAIFVEGYMDAIMSHQTGNANTIATSGTALTIEQLQLIKRFTNNLAFCFDMDLAGQNATKRGIDLAQSLGFNIKIIQTGDAKDPADIILDSPKKWRDAIDNAISVMEYYFNTAFLRINSNNAQGKKEIAGQLLPAIGQIPDKVEQSHWLRELAKKLDISERVLSESLQKLALQKRQSSHSNYANTKTQNINLIPRHEMLAERIIGLACMAEDPTEYILQIDPVDIIDKDLSLIIKEIKKHFIKKSAKKSPNIKKIIDHLPDDQANKLHLILFKAEELSNAMAEHNISSEFASCLFEIKKHGLKSKLGDLSRQIEQAEHENNKSKLKKLLLEFQNLSSNFNNK